MHKIIITGPESSGKTTLAQRLAQQYAAPWVPEFAREFLVAIKRPYREEDLLPIAIGQLDREWAVVSQAPDLLICDTSLLVVQIWGQYKYGRSHPWIAAQTARLQATHIFLCAPDLGWQPDPLREHPAMEDRQALFNLYQHEVNKLGIPFTVISGQRKRMEQAVVVMEKLHGGR